MGRFNPYRCESDSSRRLSLVLTLIAFLAWLTWVGFVSDGFAQIQPAGWVTIFAAPTASFLVLVLLSRFIRSVVPSSKRVRIMCAGSVMWVVCLFTWGYIWRWQLHFPAGQYAALFVLPVGVAWLGLLLWVWVSSAPSKSSNNSFMADGFAAA